MGAGVRDRGRSGWRELWDAAPTWDVLVVTKIDRAWRSVLEMLTDTERLLARGKSFQAATEPDLDTGGSMGCLVLSIMGAFAEFEREPDPESAPARASPVTVPREGPSASANPIKGHAEKGGSFKHPPSRSESGQKFRPLKRDGFTRGREKGQLLLGRPA